MRKYILKISNIIFDIIFLNFITLYIYQIRNKFITPRIQKIQGTIIKNRIIHKGRDLRIHGSIHISGIDNLKVGDFVRIGRGCYFSCLGGLTIGNNVQLSRNITIYTNTHDYESGTIPYDNSYILKPVKIGSSVWIGMNVTIVPGTVIEDGAIIGMGTTVSGTIPKGAIVVGARQRIVGYRNLKDFDEKKEHQKYFGYLYPEN